MHAEIRRKIILSNDTYELVIDAQYRHIEFSERDYVMVHICHERYPKHTVKKLHARTIGLTLSFVGLNPTLI